MCYPGFAEAHASEGNKRRSNRRTTTDLSERDEVQKRQQETPAVSFRH